MHDNYWCYSSNGNITSCCPKKENLFHFNFEHPAQIQNGTNFVSRYKIMRIAALATSTPWTKPQQNASSNILAKVVGDKAMMVGLGVGLGACVPLLAALATSLFLLFQEKKRNQMMSVRKSYQHQHQHQFSMATPKIRMTNLDGNSL